MRLALGPLPYHWPRNIVQRFYEGLAGTRLDVFYLGEAVCSRRHELRLADWLALGRMLRDAGKEVVLSSLGLHEPRSDGPALRRLVENGEFTVEANDMGAVRCLAGRARFVAGPHLNLYNIDAIGWVAGLGAERWVMPIEMRREDFAEVQAARPQGLEVEVFGFGRMPLAVSGRCFTARHYDLEREDCRFCCLRHPAGLMLSSRDDEPFLVLNGPQVLSARVYNLLQQVPQMAAAGLDVLRLSPLARNMPQVVALFDGVLRGTMPLAPAQSRLRVLLPSGDCNGYWFGRPGLERVEAMAG